MREIGIVALKVVGVLTVIRGIFYLGQILPISLALDDSERLWGIAAQSVAAVIFLAVGIALIAKAGPLAEIVFPDGPGPAFSLTPAELLSVLLAAVGVHLFISAVPDLFRLLMVYVQDRRNPGYELGYRQEIGQSMALVAVQMLLAVGLFYGASGLSSLWRRIHPMGRHDSPPEA